MQAPPTHRYFDALDRADWMAHLPAQLRAAPLRTLLLPATHDSGAHDLERVQLARSRGAWEYWVEKFSWFPPVRSFVRRWTLTQHEDLHAQLERGVRAFDLRIAYSERTKQFYFAHRFACMPALRGIWQIRRFLERHAGEVVMLFLRTDFENRATITEERANEFLALASQIMGDLLLPPARDGLLRDKDDTLDGLCGKGKRAILFWNGPGGGTFAWPTRVRSPSLAFTADYDQRMEANEAFLDGLPPRRVKKLNLLPMTLSPDAALIKSAALRKLSCRAAAPDSIEALAENVHAHLFQQLNAWVSEGTMQHVSLLSLDFPDSAMIDWCIEHNLETRARL